MGLFGDDETAATQAQREINARDEQIAALQRQLAASQDLKGATPKVAAGDVDLTSLEVRQVTIKLPPFSESNPELWFGKAESQFILRGIKDDTTKFHHIYSMLSEKASNEIEDLLLNPPKTGKVEAMKSRLMQKFSRSQFSRDTELLNQRSLGDLRPSEMWSKFKRLNKDHNNLTSSFVRAYLINMYPPEVRTAIANMSFPDNEEMAKAADKMLEMKTPSINAIHSGVTAEVEAGDGLPEIDAVFKGPAKGGKGGKGRGQPSTKSGAGKTCFFHDRHGPAAFKCDGTPCPFASLPLAARLGNANAGR